MPAGQRRAVKVDMTRGRMLPLVLRFALPLCVGNILQQMYLTVDTLVVGNFCSPVSLSALGTSGQPVEILLTLFVGMGSGLSILVAQYTGGGKRDRVTAILRTAVGFLYLAAIPMTVLGMLVGPYLLRMMNVPPDTYPYALGYMRILFAGTLANLGYNMNAGVLRGLGDSRSSLLFLMLSCAANIVMDVLFIAGFHMDVWGAALATIIAQYAAWLFSVFYIRRKYPELGFTLLPRALVLSDLKEMARVGVPLGVNNSFYSVGHLLMQSLVNAQGSMFIAACAVGSKLTGIANLMISSLSMATATYAAQNYGAKRYDRLRRGAAIPFISGAITLTAGLVVTAFARPLLSLFTQDPAVLDLSVTYLRLLQPFTWCYAVFNALISLANGVGEMRYPTIVNVLMLWAVRIPVGHLIANVFGGYYVSAAISVSFVFGMLCMLAFLRSARWREIGRLARQMEDGQAA
ncbi:MAG: MATE family efflux transporter [Clostridia bacterium]|nr:MATE family efflux transporter [Clostridia bacterium]